MGSLYDEEEMLPENTLGMTLTSGCVRIRKDDSNLIGVSIGGGSPLCPCVYIVQVFDNTPASRDGTLEAGDEIVAVGGVVVKGKGKTDVARMIQSTSREVAIRYNKLHADPKKGKDLDLILKKLKHAMVENMSSSTADALGLSRAILCNDSLVKKLQDLERTEIMYRGLVDHTRAVLRSTFDLLILSRELGDVFCNIGVREPQRAAHQAFCQFGEYHRQIEKCGIKMLKATKPILGDLGTYLTKAIPDTKLTIKKYADVKFEYLSFCLKVKEMDDEDASFAVMGEPLYRVETGNYEYRLVLRCRADAKKRFARLRSDVLTKLELLDNKHVQDIVFQLKRLMANLSVFHKECQELMSADSKLFPVEIDFEQSSCGRQVPSEDPDGGGDDDDDDAGNEDLFEDVDVRHCVEHDVPAAPPGRTRPPITSTSTDLLDISSTMEDGGGFPGTSLSPPDHSRPRVDPPKLDRNDGQPPPPPPADVDDDLLLSLN